MVSKLMAMLYGRRGGMKNRTLAWPVALLIVVVLNLGSAYLAMGLNINNAPEVQSKADAPAILLRQALRADFPNDEALTVIFQGDDLYTKEFLVKLDRLATAIQRDPLVDRVTSVVSLERITGSSDGFAVERLIDVSKLDAKATPEKLRQRVMEDRFAPGLLASKDGTVLAMAVRPKALSQSYERLALKVTVAAAINDAGLRSYYAGDAGPVTMDVAQLESLIRDSLVFVPLTVVIGLVLLGWVVGRLRPVVIGGVALSTVVLPTIAGVAVSGQPYTMATAILPSLLAAYTLANLLHLYAAVQRSQTATSSRRGFIDRALTDTLKPSVFNVLTTGAGLLSLVLVPMPPIQVFGIAGALGTVLVFLTVFVLVPPFLISFDRKLWPRQGSGMNRMGKLARRVTLFSMRNARAVVVVSLCTLVVGVPFALKVEAESDVLAFFKPDHPINQHNRIIESKLSGVTSLEISLRGADRDSLQNVATLEAVRSLQLWLEALPEVDRAVSMVDLIEEMNWAMSGEATEARTLPKTDRLLSQYLLVYDGNDLYELVNRDFQHARIVLNLNVHGASEISRTIATIRQHLAEKPLDGVTVDIGGFGRLFADQVDLLVEGQIDSFAGAFIQIFLLMALLWRSFSAATVALIPNLAPLFFIFVLMGSTGTHLDLATVMIAGIVLGITVDDTIHLFYGYRTRCRAGISPVLAIARSFESSGRAVMAISVVLTAQFALLATSDFIPTSNFGLLTCVGLLAGQVAELFLLPALLVLKDTRRVARAKRLGQHKTTDEARNSQGWAATELLERPANQSITGLRKNVAALSTQAVGRSGDLSSKQLILVCQGPACRNKGAHALWKSLNAQPAALPTTAAIQASDGQRLLVRTSCLGRCDLAPTVHRSALGTPTCGTASSLTGNEVMNKSAHNL